MTDTTDKAAKADFATCTTLAAAAVRAASDTAAASGAIGNNAYGFGPAIELGVGIGRLYFEKCAAGEAASLPRLPIIRGKDYNIDR